MRKPHQEDYLTAMLTALLLDPAFKVQKLFGLGSCWILDDDDEKSVSSDADDAWEDPYLAESKINLIYLAKLHPSIADHCAKFNHYIEQVMRKDPCAAKFRYKFDKYFQEPLLYRVLCYKPPLHLVKMIHFANPGATKEKSAYHKTPLHCACQFRASAEVIEYLIQEYPEALAEEPSPLYIAIHPETKQGVIELLAKAYPKAIAVPSDGKYTPLDYAMIENLPPCVIRTLIRFYPSATLTVTALEGGPPIGPSVIEVLTTTVEHIRELDVSAIHLSKEALFRLLEGVYTNRKLECLIFSVNTIEVSARISNMLFMMLKSNRVLKKLVFRGGIHSESLATALANGMATNSTLQELVIEGGLSSESLSRLFVSLSRSHSLLKLSLLGNRLYHYENQACWEGIASLVNIQELDLTGCIAGAVLGTSLASLVRTTRKLSVLGISANNIGDAVFSEVASALSNNASILNIDATENQVGPEGTQALVKSLESCNYTLCNVRFGSADDTAVMNQVKYFCRLNQAGRKQVCDTSKQLFVADMLTPHVDDISTLYGLLRHVPHIWSSSQ